MLTLRRHLEDIDTERHDHYTHSEFHAALDELRSLEAQLANIQANGPVIACEAGRASLRVFNEHTKTWWKTDLIQETPYER